MGFFTGSDPGLETFSAIQASQKDVLGSLGGFFETLIAGIPGELAPGFPNLQAAVPDLSSLQQLSLAGFEALGLGQPTGTTAERGANAGKAQVAKIFSQGPADFEDFFRTNIEDPAFEQFR